MKSRMIVDLKIRLNNVDECEAVRKAVQVDNTDLPECIREISLRCDESTLVTYISCEISESQNILTIWSTVDDLVRCIRAALEALREVEKKRI